MERIRVLRSSASHWQLQLLDFETLASDQVPLLLEMKEDRLALAKAVNSGDTDLSE